MKKRLIYCDVCRSKIGPITDRDWAEGVSHQFAPFRRPEPPEKSDDHIVLVIHAEKRNEWSGQQEFPVDICRRCTMSMIEEIVKETEDVGDV